MKIVVGNIKIKKTMEKHCKGYYDLLKRETVPCQSFTDLTESEYCQCKACQTKSGFDLCLGYNGSICRTNSDTARKFCNEEHHVYLAYFANDKLKVGTAASYRKYERLLEQGAVYSIFLAQTPNGRIARQLESRISNLGIASRANSSYKMNNFIIDREQEEIDKMLMKEYEFILQKIDEISQIAKKYNILFHTDSVQAIGNIKIDVQNMNIESLSLSAHKFYGPKGIGVLYLRDGVKFRKYLNGGHQERNRRAGTENVAGNMQDYLLKFNKFN